MNLKYIEYEEKYKDQVHQLYISNCPRTSIVKGYDYFNLAYKEHGAIKLTLFTISWYFFFRFILLNFQFSELSIMLYFVIHLHIILFNIAPLIMKYLTYKYLHKNILSQDFMDTKLTFTYPNRLFLAINIDNDELVGMVGFTYNRDSKLQIDSSISGQLSRMSVKTSYGKQGIATNLLRMVENHAIQLKIKHLYFYFLNANIAANNFYIKHGFQKYPFTYYHYWISKLLGIKGQMMIKNLQ